MGTSYYQTLEDKRKVVVGQECICDAGFGHIIEVVNWTTLIIFAKATGRAIKRDIDSVELVKLPKVY